MKNEFLMRKLQNCDEAFAQYLSYSADKCNEEYFIKMIRILILYRDFMNTHSDKLNELKKDIPEDVSLKDNEEVKTSEYCVINNAEQIPEMSNEFIDNYEGSIKEYDLDLDDIKELIFHFFNWLFFNGYTFALIYKKSVHEDNQYTS